ncbi:hypothetical protein BDV38DRAFT_261724 [Aspergillus pseudotamarii]|uniref:Uncharacterized protein n=1 Tax=Aspergillus pseudotamarii TaxID=132259 RepID=A0A5N6SC76_ASPPS|nr:uncharacterized protein BDV38DRAFT_261724 [Aspergillus pseudotamarii]KAE8132308.1 hypothetical protein BDV38DRAFT_261724 [Aspergillus pseudotamarii]
MVNRYSRLMSTCPTQMGLSPATISLWVIQTSPWKSHVLFFCILLVILPESKLKGSGFVRMESRS